MIGLLPQILWGLPAAYNSVLLVAFILSGYGAFRLTLLYSGLFAACGAILVVITYALLAANLPQVEKPATTVPGLCRAFSTVRPRLMRGFAGGGGFDVVDVGVACSEGTPTGSPAAAVVQAATPLSSANAASSASGRLRGTHSS